MNLIHACLHGLFHVQDALTWHTHTPKDLQIKAEIIPLYLKLGVIWFCCDCSEKDFLLRGYSLFFKELFHFPPLSIQM